MHRSTHAIAAFLLVTLGANGIGLADTATKPGLEPQFSRWPVPIYTSNVTGTTTYAANSYGIETKDSRSKVISWYLGKLKSRAEQIHKDARPTLPAQIMVDNGDFVINLENNSGATSINVLKN